MKFEEFKDRLQKIGRNSYGRIPIGFSGTAHIYYFDVNVDYYEYQADDAKTFEFWFGEGKYSNDDFSAIDYDSFVIDEDRMRAMYDWIKMIVIEESKLLAAFVEKFD